MTRVNREKCSLLASDNSVAHYLSFMWVAKHSSISAVSCPGIGRKAVY